MESHRENMAGKGLPLGHPDFESDQWSNFFFVCDNVNDDLNEKLSLPKSDFVLDKMFEKMRKIQIKFAISHPHICSFWLFHLSEPGDL